MLHPFMPYVTEEIYSMLPNKKEESIMLSTYPTYDKKTVFTESEKMIDETLEFITMCRVKKQELNIGSEFNVKINVSNEFIKTLIIKSLKLEDKQLELDAKIQDDASIEMIRLNDLQLEIIYDDSKNKLEIKKTLEKERDSLIQSIERRKKLLGNENYVQKAPSQIVEKEREALKKEEEQLELVNQKLN